MSHYWPWYKGFGGAFAVFQGKQSWPPLIISVALALIYLADRSDFCLKEQRQFNPWSFGVLCVLSLALGLATVKCGDNDMGLLNRNQTDEWKGWMQSTNPPWLCHDTCLTQQRQSLSSSTTTSMDPRSREYTIQFGYWLHHFSLWLGTATQHFIFAKQTLASRELPKWVN